MKRGQRQRIEEIPTARPGEKPRSPKRGRLPRHDFPISLKHVARHVGRLRGLIHLARHCHDERIQQMVAAWDGLAAYQRPSTTLAQLCEAAEIEPRAFLAELVRTAWDFNHKNRLEDVTRGIGGRQGLIDLARECEDGRIKAMVDVWDSLDCKARKRTQLATLCAMHGVKRRDFLAEVVTTLWDLNVDVSTLLRVIAGPLAARRTLRTPPRPKGRCRHYFPLGIDGLARQAGGRRTFLELGALSDDEQVRQVAVVWNSLSARDKRTCSLEELCNAVGIEPSRLFGSVAVTAVRHNMDMTKLILALNAPHLMQELVERALQPDGDRERELYFKMWGEIHGE